MDSLSPATDCIRRRRRRAYLWPPVRQDIAPLPTSFILHRAASRYQRTQAWDWNLQPSPELRHSPACCVRWVTNAITIMCVCWPAAARAHATTAPTVGVLRRSNWVICATDVHGGSLAVRSECVELTTMGCTISDTSLTICTVRRHVLIVVQVAMFDVFCFCCVLFDKYSWINN